VCVGGGGCCHLQGCSLFVCAGGGVLPLKGGGDELFGIISEFVKVLPRDDAYNRIGSAGMSWTSGTKGGL
jgi:hypothetical protein